MVYLIKRNDKTSTKKIMKKNIFYTVALLLAGAVMTACSGGDDVTSNVTPVPQPSAKAGVVELHGTLGSRGDLTRSYFWPNKKNGIITGYSNFWEEDDQFAIYYETTNGHATAIATVNSVDGRSAEFTATLINPKMGDNNVTFVYPYTAHDGKGGFKTDALKNQDGGNLEYFPQKGLDIERVETILSVEETEATLKDDVVTMEPQVCIYYIKLKDFYDNSLSATKLEISDGTHNYTIIPAAATSYFDVALLPVENANFTFTATTTKSGTVYTKLKTLADCTADNVGDLIDGNGNIIIDSGSSSNMIYTRSFSDKTLEASKYYSSDVRLISSTPVAMIAYVGGNGSVETGSNYRGLAVALADCFYDNCDVTISQFSGTSWCTQSSETCTSKYSTDVTAARGWKDGISMTASLVSKDGHTHNAAKAASTYKSPCPTTSGWFLPSLGQWQLILQGLITKAGYQPDPISTSGNEKLNYNLYYPILQNAGTFFSYCYWSSSEYNASMGWGIGTEQGGAFTYSKTSQSMLHVRAVLAF